MLRLVLGLLTALRPSPWGGINDVLNGSLSSPSAIVSVLSLISWNLLSPTARSPRSGTDAAGTEPHAGLSRKRISDLKLSLLAAAVAMRGAIVLRLLENCSSAGALPRGIPNEFLVEHSKCGVDPRAMAQNM